MKRRPFLGLLGLLALSAAPGPAVPFPHPPGRPSCWAYYTVKALYRLGRAGEARRIFDPMLAGYARGEFQGFCADGRSRDWRDWRGGCHGYEGLLVDNYHALLAVLDDVKAKR